MGTEFKSGVTESRFYMWRAILAIAHADHIVALEEINLLSHLLQTDNLSSGQREMLMRDIQHPQNYESMFKCITNLDDRKDFFKFAQQMAFCDNNFHPLERKMIDRLHSIAS